MCVWEGGLVCWVFEILAGERKAVLLSDVGGSGAYTVCERGRRRLAMGEACTNMINILFNTYSPAHTFVPYAFIHTHTHTLTHTHTSFARAVFTLHCTLCTHLQQTTAARLPCTT